MPVLVGYYVADDSRCRARRAKIITRRLFHPFRILSPNTSGSGELFDPDVCVSLARAGGVGNEEDAEDFGQNAFTEWVAMERPTLLVVDGAPEIALAAHELSVPTIVIRGFGLSLPSVQRVAETTAHSLLAPFLEAMEPADTSNVIIGKTCYCGGFASYGGEGLALSSADALDVAMVRSRRAMGRKYAVITRRFRGARDAVDALSGMAEALPGWDLIAFHPSRLAEHDLPSNVFMRLNASMALPYIYGANALIGPCDEWTLADAATAGVPFVAIPDDALFDAEMLVARRLRELELATVLDEWPSTQDWLEIVENAANRGPRLRTIINDRAADIAAQHIDKVVEMVGKGKDS